MNEPIRPNPIKVTIMRGLPGSGKSTWMNAHRARNRDELLEIVSADDYHMEHDTTGRLVYRFRKERAAEAHDKCLATFIRTVSSARERGGRDELVTRIYVDNTNLSAWEIAPYYRVAEVAGAEVDIVHCLCSVFTSLARNTHAVPAETIWAMSRRIDDLPTWWRQTVVNTEPRR